MLLGVAVCPDDRTVDLLYAPPGFWLEALELVHGGWGIGVALPIFTHEIDEQ